VRHAHKERAPSHDVARGYRAQRALEAFLTALARRPLAMGMNGVLRARQRDSILPLRLFVRYNEVCVKRSSIG